MVASDRPYLLIEMKGLPISISSVLYLLFFKKNLENILAYCSGPGYLVTSETTASVYVPLTESVPIGLPGLRMPPLPPACPVHCYCQFCTS